MTDGIGNRHDAQAERQRHADEADANLGKAGRDDRAAASRKSEPKRPNRLGGVFFCIHISPPACFESLNTRKSPVRGSLIQGNRARTGRILPNFRGFPSPKKRLRRWTFPFLSGTCPRSG